MGGNVEKFLKELLYDYVSFALFTAAGWSVGRRRTRASASRSSR
jgi:hypothetical protein